MFPSESGPSESGHAFPSESGPSESGPCVLEWTMCSLVRVDLVRVDMCSRVDHVFPSESGSSEWTTCSLVRVDLVRVDLMGTGEHVVHSHMSAPHGPTFTPYTWKHLIWPPLGYINLGN